MNTKNISRRSFTRLVGASAATAAIAGFAKAPFAQQVKAPHVVIIGGGFGGATVARYLRQLDRTIRVTVIEPSQLFYTCPFSNLVLGGLRTMESIGHGYAKLRAVGVTVTHALADTVDTAKKTVTLTGNAGTLNYDYLVVSPGVDLKWNAIAGYDEAASQIMPHAWKAGPQTLLLRQKLQAMPDGGTFIIAAPADPFRCPPGPYERVSMVAHYFKTRKPKSKIVILDAKEQFSKQGLFMEAWKNLYPGMIDFVPLSKDGKVTKVDTKELQVETEFGTKHKAAVFNIVPPQQAGAIAHKAGLTNASGWCPIDPATFESTQAKGVYVIGDASISAPMPKSGFSANSQGKIVALSIAAQVKGKTTVTPSFANTCYSVCGPDYGISVANVYKADAGKMTVLPGGGVSPINAPPEFRKQEAANALSWYANISADIWG